MSELLQVMELLRLFFLQQAMLKIDHAGNPKEWKKLVGTVDSKHYLYETH